MPCVNRHRDARRCVAPIGLVRIEQRGKAGACADLRYSVQGLSLSSSVVDKTYVLLICVLKAMRAVGLTFNEISPS